MIKPLNKSKKKSHGGLKFLLFLGAVAMLIFSISIGLGTEVGQRIVGHREDRRVEHTTLTPRFGYAAAKLRVTVGSIYNSGGATMDLTTTEDVSIDRQTATASSDVKVSRTQPQVVSGTGTTPVIDVDESYTEVLTKSYRYDSPSNDDEPWTRSTVEPHHYGTVLDQHYIPTIDDIMGFELRGLPSKPIALDAASGLGPTNSPTPPAAVTRSYSYEFDMATFKRAVPILANRSLFMAPPDTPVTLTVGFDDVGLLRFADFAIPSSMATKYAEQFGSDRTAFYHYTLEVTDISGEPINIKIPTDVVDAD
jgi:hypothetical protein